ncbi:hypothetical protein [Streptomyces sp. NPDC060027]
MTILRSPLATIWRASLMASGLVISMTKLLPVMSCMLKYAASSAAPACPL